MMQTAIASVIALGVLYVAWQQWKLAEHKLKMELFDRRFKIYSAVREMIVRSTTTGLLSNEASELYGRTREADYLFEQEVCDYIDKVWWHVTVRLDIERRFKSDNLPQSERESLAAKDLELGKWMETQAFKGCVDTFRPYLSLAHVR